MRSLLLALPLVLASLAGCKKHVADCGDVADNMIVVTRDAVAKTGNPPPKRDQLIAECTARKLDQKEKVCMATAKDIEGLAKCVGKRVQAPRDRSGYETDEPPPPDLTKLPPGHPQVDHAMTDPRMGSDAPGAGSAAAGSAATGSPATGSGSAK